MIFVFDLDGTICFDGHSLPESIVQTLLAAEQFGHEVAFASARSYRDCLGVLGETFRHHLVICLNGGLVYKNGQLLYQQILPQQTLDSLLAICQAHDLPYFLDNHMDYASNRPEKIPFFATVDPLKVATRRPLADLTNPTKLVIFMGEQEQQTFKVASVLSEADELNSFYHEQEKCFYINPAGVSKGAMVELFCGQDVIAFGNDKNDIEFFELSRYAVQIGDYEPLSAFADQQVPAQAEAVAAAIRQLYERFEG